MSHKTTVGESSSMGGVNGTNGTNGANGANGPQGPPGTNGTNGTNGLNGAAGTNGLNGATGTSGAAGPQGNPGPSGSNGTNGVNASAGLHTTLWHDESNVLAGAAIVGYPASAWYGVTFQQTPSALNDAFSQTFVMQPGSYILYILCALVSTNGILTVSIDGINQGSIDLYVAGNPVFNSYQSMAITVPAGTQHTFRGVVASKNTSSTGYQMPVVKFFMK